MTSDRSSPAELPARPRALDIAFWLLLVGVVLLLVGGLFSVTIGYDTVRGVAPASISDDQVRNYLVLQRGSAAICIAAGAGLGFLAGRMRTGDVRFRRATVALALVTVVLVGVIAVFVGIHVVALLGTLPIIAAAVLLTRPVVTEWFDGAHD